MDENFIKFNFIDNFVKTNSRYRLVLSGLLSPFDIFLIKSLVEKKQKILYVTSDE